MGWGSWTSAREQSDSECEMAEGQLLSFISGVDLTEAIVQAMTIQLRKESAVWPAAKDRGWSLRWSMARSKRELRSALLRLAQVQFQVICPLYSLLWKIADKCIWDTWTSCQYFCGTSRVTQKTRRQILDRHFDVGSCKEEEVEKCDENVRCTGDSLSPQRIRGATHFRKNWVGPKSYLFLGDSPNY